MKYVPSITTRISVQWLYRRPFYTCLSRSRDSAVGIATRCGIENPGIELRWWGQNFPHQSRPVLGPIQPPIQWVPGHVGGGDKAVGRGVDHPPPSSAQVKEKVELNLYFSCVSSWPVLGLPFTLTFQKLRKILLLIKQTPFVTLYTFTLQIMCFINNTFRHEINFWLRLGFRVSSCRVVW
jgi:hypothetical protein